MVNKHKQNKELILLIGSLIIVVLCLLIVAWLQYQSFTLDKPLPEYSIGIFASIATLVIGYIFGKGGSK